MHHNHVNILYFPHPICAYYLEEMASDIFTVVLQVIDFVFPYLKSSLKIFGTIEG